MMSFLRRGAAQHLSKKEARGVTEPGFKEILVSTRQARGIPRCEGMSNNQIRSGPSVGLLTQRKP